MSCLPAALDYIERGFSVLPTRGKRPLVKWAEFQHRLPTQREVRDWWSRWPDAQVAVVTGRVSGLVCLDEDGPQAETSLRGRPLPISPVVRTPHGLHRWFRHPGSGRLKSVTRILPGNDVRADAGYCIAPPSRHVNGAQYEWLPDLSLDDVELPACPEWLVHMITVRQNGARLPSNEYALLGKPFGEGPGIRDALSSLPACPGFVERAAALLGIPAEYVLGEGFGRSFCCILPGHEEHGPSASLCRGDNGVCVYRDWHGRDGQGLYLLSEVRASLAYGKAVKLGWPENATWLLRLMVETGFAVPAEVEMPPLPVDCSSYLRKVYDGFKLLLGCRWLHTPGAPAPLAWRFAAAWCGVSKPTAGKAIRELLRLGIIQVVGKHKVMGKAMNLYLPVGYGQSHGGSGLAGRSTGK